MSIKQGEIWEVEFFPQVGSEIGKKRPALVVSHDTIGRLPLKTIVPITDWSKNFVDYPWFVNIKQSSENGLTKESGIDCFQVKSFSDKRFIKRIGIIDNNQLVLVHNTIAKTLNPKYNLN